MMDIMKSINIAKEFTRYPAGRFRSDGPYSGERFREDLLVPALKETDVVEVELDGVAGYGSSFLDEAFGGLIRAHVLSSVDAPKRIRLHASDESLVNEILSYMSS
jgi:STAS-like domain of unknown function (DUF4325)